jgi:predicted regulator of Ras-like GTPase activity (Roadblock/LC7/MglB family)
MSNLPMFLEQFLKESNANAIIIHDSDGNLIESINVKYDDSIAAMSGAIVSMSQKFLEDLEDGLLKQAYLKTNKTVIVFNAIDAKKTVVVFAETATNLGLFLHKVEELAASLNLNFNP